MWVLAPAGRAPLLRVGIPRPKKTPIFFKHGFKRWAGEGGFQSRGSSRGPAEEHSHKHGLLLPCFPDLGVQGSHFVGIFFCHEFGKSKSFGLLIFRNTSPRKKPHSINKVILRMVLLITRRITVFWGTQQAGISEMKLGIIETCNKDSRYP